MSLIVFGLDKKDGIVGRIKKRYKINIIIKIIRVIKEKRYKMLKDFSVCSFFIFVCWDYEW